MSRFEFRASGMEQALADLYDVRDEIRRQADILKRQSRELGFENDAVTRRARDALKRLEAEAELQKAGTDQAIRVLKQVRESVRKAEWNTLRGQLESQGFAENAETYLSAGLRGEQGKPESPFFQTEYSGSMGVDYEIFKNGEYRPTIGIGAAGEASFSLFAKEMEAKDGLLESKFGVDVGKAAVSGKVRGVLFEDGKFDPELDIAGKFSLEGVTFSGEEQFGTEDFNVYSTQELTAGYAEVKGEVSVDKDGVDIEAGAGAYAVEGEVTAGFELFGIKIEVEGEGKLGGISAGGEFHASSEEIEIGGEIGLIAGLGLKIRIDWGDD